MGGLLAAVVSSAVVAEPAPAPDRADPEDVEEVIVSADRLPVPSRIEMTDTSLSNSATAARAAGPH